MSETAVNAIIIVGFLAVVGMCLPIVRAWGRARARRFGATEADLDTAFEKAKSKLGIIAVALVLLAGVILLAAWIYLNILA